MSETPVTAHPESEPIGAAGSSARRVAGNALALTAATILARLAMFALGIALANGLGPDDYGRYGIGVSLAVILIPLADIGLTPYLTREMARAPHDTRALLRRLTALRSLLGLAASGIAAVLVIVLVGDGRTEWALLLAVAAASFDGLAQFAFAYFQGIERMGAQAWLTSGSSLARAAGGILLAVTTGDLALVLVWLLLVSIGQAAWALVAMRRRLRDAPPRTPRPAPAERPRISLEAILAMGVVTVLVAVVLRADSLLVGWLRSEREAGIYTAAWVLMGGLQIVPWMVSVALAPVFARTFAGDRATFGTALGEGLRSVVLLALPVTLLVCLLAGPVVDRFFGESYDPARLALQILVWSVPLAAIGSVATMALRGAGRERALTAVFGVGAAGNIGANLWAIDAHGIAGAAAVNVGTELVLTALLLALLTRHALLPMPRLRAGRLVAGLVVLAAVALAVRDRVPVEVALLLGASAFGVIAWATRLITAADVAALRPRA